MLPLTQYKVLTFDCYGTLIDWEAGILAALEPLLQRHGVDLDRATLLGAYADLETELEHGPQRAYRAILEDVVAGFGQRYGFTPSEEDCRSLPESMAHWPPFADSVQALQILASHYDLAVISNVDDDLFRGSAVQLQVDFKDVITAQQVGSYKPSLNNFEVAHQRLGIAKEEWLHVAQSRFHDVAPATEFGLKTCWINRQAGRAGATKPSEAVPSWEVPDLATFAAAVAQAFA